MDEEIKPKKMGRPKRYHEKRLNLSIRLTPGVYDSIKAASIESRRSISEEMEYRLAQSLLAPDVVSRVEQMLEHLMKKAALTGFRAGFDFATETRG